MSPSPTRTLPGASAPSRSPRASTSRTSARASLPKDCGSSESSCQCMKAKWKHSGLLVANQASCCQKSSKSSRKPLPSRELGSTSKTMRAMRHSSLSAHWRTRWAKAPLLP
ncbi:hypothetical protein [Myxococcus sp. RHSTA-1-4]|uniref:hypothetical protein n=1 Tax=Myxococcus sp. RHSTA-1-4 TaxID=2874601 RepID=UPI001CBAD2BC|nr:hypothetical protein [Myxococcus sp. RHSTA-1-4]MBZ4415768.1 hypothetical protein [Myxococcus sp. RHSTA-1-4]